MPDQPPSTTTTVLVVDDEPLNLALMSQLLQPSYRVLCARAGTAALSLLRAGERPALILLDVMMPDMDGFSVLAELQREPRWREIPVVFVTALHGEMDEEHGLACGAVDYITKPIKSAVVLARVRTHIELRQARDRLADQNSWLEAELARRVRDSLLARDLVLAAMAQLAETRDSDTGNHILRTQGYVALLARHLQTDARYAPELGEAQLQRIVKASPMHDIGKIGIPDHILLKPGRLTPEELVVMKTHSALGGQVLGRAIAAAMALHQADGGATDSPPEALLDLEAARRIALHHHERWDGTGYPDGLAGDRIPLPARLMAVADVFDALTMPRVYKPAWPLDKAVAHILSESGTHFDPAVVAAFAAERGAFAAIAARLAD